MKKISIYIVALSMLLFSSCNSFLDSEDYLNKDSSNFPKTVADTEALLAGIYSAMNRNLGNNDIVGSVYYVSELASDDRFGGGGEDDKNTQALDRLQNYGTDLFRPIWKTRYAAIYSANLGIETVDNVTDWPKDDASMTKAINKYLAQLHFLRGIYYLDLAQIFGDVPLRLTTVKENLPKAGVDDVYAQIAFDLKKAIELFPADKYDAAQAGRATKWAAEAYMARTFLFYTGYYKKDALPLPEGGSITKAEVVKWLEDCIANSGHKLYEQDYRSLFTYTNKFTKPNLPEIKDADFEWVGDGNNETVYAVKFSNFVDWGNSAGYSNRYCLFFGLRAAETKGEDKTFPYGKGWGAGTVNPMFFDEWKTAEPTDKRRQATILDIDAELPEYVYGEQRHMEETGYVQKKYIPITAQNKDNDNKLTLFDNLMWGEAPDAQLANRQDLVLMRYSDILLMHSELTETNTYLNQVRKRVGLPDVSYSLEAVQKERRWELAFEGVRWFDLLRWGIAAEKLDSQEQARIKNNNVDTKMKHLGSGYSSRLKATGGFWPIPQSQIDLSGGVLIQNPGWKGDSDSEFKGW